MSLENLFKFKSDFDDTDDNHLSVKSRQWLQIEKRVAESLGKPVDFYLDVENLRDEMVEWKFPLHFIDFETCTSALIYYFSHIVYSEETFNTNLNILMQNLESFLITSLLN